MVPDDAFCLSAITMTDLYPKDSWNFVFGQARLYQRVGIYSLARYMPNFDDDSSSLSKASQTTSSHSAPSLSELVYY